MHIPVSSFDSLAITNNLQAKPFIRLLTSKLFDTASSSFIQDATILVDRQSGIILDVSSSSSLSQSQLQLVETIDLRHLTVLPGLIDAHVHLFLHPYSETPWPKQVLEESIVERTVRAVTHARATIMAGYTAVRDLGTEGALDADIHLRKSLSPPLSLSPAPRMFISSKAIVSTGSYGPKTEKWDDPGGIEQGQVVGAEAVDGVEEMKKAVRRQIGRGADWIKIYADYLTRGYSSTTSPRAASKGYPVFTFEEMKAAVDTAANQGVKVAAHCTSAAVMKLCVKAGIATIEHGYDADEEALVAMKEAGTIWVPTLAAYSQGAMAIRETFVKAEMLHSLMPSEKTNHDMRNLRAELRVAEDRWQRMKRAFALGLKVGVKIGVFAHGNNSLELLRMIELGVDPKTVLSWCTGHGWEVIRPSSYDGKEGEAFIEEWEAFAESKYSQLQRGATFDDGDAPGGWNETPLGSIRKGFAADIIAVQGDLETTSPEEFVSALKKVEFVMLGGKVVKS